MLWCCEGKQIVNKSTGPPRPSEENGEDGERLLPISGSTWCFLNNNYLKTKKIIKWH